jgi:hypothetical protein
MSTDLPAQGTSAVPASLDPAADPASWAPPQPGPRCPWCSARLATLDVANCPSCNAQLLGADTGLPGLTEVVPPSAAKAVPVETVKRNRLLAWISGEVLDDEPAPTGDVPAEALARPSLDVRREILRLELEAAGIQLPPVAPAEGDATSTDGTLDAPSASSADASESRESSAA